MAYTLIWIAALSTSLLMTATGIAHAAGMNSRLWREFVAALLFSLPAAAYAVFTVVFFLFFAEKYVPAWPFLYGLSLFVLHLAGGGWLLRKGLRPKTASPSAKLWNRGLISLAFGLAIVFFVSSYWMTDLERKTALAHVNAQIRGRACSLYPSPVPQLMNAAEVYRKAYDTLVGKAPPPAWLGTTAAPEHYVLPREVVKFVKKNRSVIQLLRQAGEMPGFYLPRDASRLVGSPVHPVDIYWSLARFLALDAGLKAAEGDSEKAVENLALLRAMMEHLLSVTDIVTFYSAARVAEIGLQGLERVLAEDAAGMPIPPMPREGNATRRAVFSHVFEIAELYDLDINVMMAQPRRPVPGLPSDFALAVPTSYPPFARSLWRVFVMPGELQCVRATWRRIKDMAAKPYYDNRQDLRALEKRFEEDPKGRIMKNIYSNWSRYINGECARLDAAVRLMDVALAVTAHLQQRGLYPLRLSDLVPAHLKETPIDPFTGKPIELKPMTGGFRLSVAGSRKWAGGTDLYFGKKLYEEKRVVPARQALEGKKPPVRGKKKRRTKK